MDRHRGHGAEQDGQDGQNEQSAPVQSGGCAAFGPLLEAYYHHALASEQTRSVAEHVAGCVACGSALDSYAATDRLIATAPTAQPGPELRQRLAARIAAARAQRSAESVTPMSIERTTVVNDVNDANSMNDSHWANTDARMRQVGAGRGIQRLRVIFGTAAAVLIVALLAGMFALRTRGPAAGNLTATPTPGQRNQTTIAQCGPGKIMANLPAYSYLTDLAMVSPTEGWAVGALQNSPESGPVNALIVRYHNCAWMPIKINYPGMALTGISMVSASEGWAVGGSSAGKQLALHYTDGAWQQVTLPNENTALGVYQSVHMRSADEGWIVMRNQKDSEGLLKEHLLHLSNGRWSVVDTPLSLVRSVLPVASNDAWIAGFTSDRDQIPTLYHYQAGKWTHTTLPSGVVIDQLQMVSPTDIWASGHINAQTNWVVDQSAAVLHYDGSAWQQVAVGANGHPQFVQAFGNGTSWAFTLKAMQDRNSFGYIISGAQYQQGGAWRSVAWSFDDVFNNGGAASLVRVAADEYWAIGMYTVSKTTTRGSGTSTATYGANVLLHFADGAWHEYGR